MTEDAEKRSQRSEELQHWLAHMDDALDDFMRNLPPEIARRLDYGIDSLDVLEKVLLERYESYDAAKRSGEASFFDGCSRYLGETVRRRLGGKWRMVLDDEKNVHYGVPRLQGFDVPMSPMAPLHMCSSAVDRRKGNYLTCVIRNFYRGP